MKQDQLIRDLREKLLQMDQGRRPEKREASRFPGLEALVRWLPGGGLTPGTMIEWLSGCEGCGAATLAFVVAGQVQQQGGAVVVIDERHDFYPPAAQGLGVALERMVVVQPHEPAEALWAWEQSLRSPAVAVAVGWREKLNDRLFRRLQLAAETGRTMGFLVRPASCRVEPSWAEARLLVEPMPSAGHRGVPARRFRVEVLYARGGFGGRVIELELRDEANAVHLVPAVARAEAAERSAGA